MRLRRSAAIWGWLALSIAGFWSPAMADVPMEVATAETGLEPWAIIGAGALALIVLSRRLRTR